MNDEEFEMPALKKDATSESSLEKKEYHSYEDDNRSPLLRDEEDSIHISTSTDQDLRSNLYDEKNDNDFIRQEEYSSPQDNEHFRYEEKKDYQPSQESYASFKENEHQEKIKEDYHVPSKNLKEKQADIDKNEHLDEGKPSKLSQIVGTTIVVILTLLIVFWLFKQYFTL